MKRIFIFLPILLLIISCQPEVIDYNEVDKNLIKDFLSENNLNATETNSGLFYIIDNPGEDVHPQFNSVVNVNYTGMLLDSTVFDKTDDVAINLNLTNTIKGFQEGLQLIGIGGKIKLFIPSDLGYGNNSTDKIPQHSVLIFDIKLNEFY